MFDFSPAISRTNRRTNGSPSSSPRSIRHEPSGRLRAALPSPPAFRRCDRTPIFAVRRSCWCCINKGCCPRQSSASTYFSTSVAINLSYQLLLIQDSTNAYTHTQTNRKKQSLLPNTKYSKRWKTTRCKSFVNV